MKIQDILSEKGILINLKTDTKYNVLNQMGRYLASVFNLQQSDIIIQKILDREAEISTGIGFGIAIPHARTDSVDQLCIIAARCVEGIEFESLDEQPVHLIFMLASPQANSDELRSILSALSKIMSYEEIRKKLLAASDPNEFLTLLVEGENKYVTA